MEGKDGNTCGSDQGTSGHLVQSSSGADRGRKGYRQYHKGRDYRGRSNAERGVPKVLTPRSYSSVASPQSEKPSHMQPTESFKNKILPSRPAREIVQIDKAQLDGLHAELKKMRIELEKLRTDKENQRVELEKHEEFADSIREKFPIRDEVIEWCAEQAKGDDQQFYELCDFHKKLILVIGKNKKAYTDPLSFIRDAEEYLKQKNEILASECTWGAYCLAVGNFYKDLGIKIRSHTARSLLVDFAASFDKKDGGYISSLAGYGDAAHTNFYNGEDETAVVKKRIKFVEKFIELFGKIDKELVRKDLEQHLPKTKYEKNTYEEVTFKYHPKKGRVFGSGPFHFEYEAYAVPLND